MPGCRLTTPTEGHSRYQQGRWYDLAGLRGHTEVLLFVLSRGEPPANLATACHYAAAAGRVHTLRALLQAGVPLLRTSALRDAVDQQRVDIVATALPYCSDGVIAEEACHLVWRACRLPYEGRLSMVNAILAASWPRMAAEQRCRAALAALNGLRDRGELRAVHDWVRAQPDGPDCCLVAAVEARDKAKALGLLEGGAASPAACNARALLQAVRTGQLRVVRTMVRLHGPQHAHARGWDRQQLRRPGGDPHTHEEGASRARAVVRALARAGRYLVCAGPQPLLPTRQQEVHPEPLCQRELPQRKSVGLQPQQCQGDPGHLERREHDKGEQRNEGQQHGEGQPRAGEGCPGGGGAGRLTSAQVAQALVCALRYSTVDMLCCLLEGGPDLAHRADGRTLLAHALAADLRDDPSGLGRVRLLLGRGAEPQDGFTLRVAAEAGCITALQLLLDAGARVHGAQGLGLVYAAARSRDRRVAGFLLQRLQGVGRDVEAHPHAVLLLRAALGGREALLAQLRLLGLSQTGALLCGMRGERAFCAAVGRELGTALLQLAGR